MKKKNTKNYSEKDFYGEKINKLEGNYMEFFKTQGTTDEWYSVPISELNCFGIENNMLTVTDKENGTVECESRVVDYYTEKIRKTKVTVNCAIEDIQNLVEGDSATRLVVKFPATDHYVAYPLARTSRDGLYGRTGTGETRVDNSLGDNDEKFLEFNPYARASQINEHAVAWKSGEVQLLVRDNRLIGCHSKDYAVLPMYRLIEETEITLDKRYKKDYKFVGGRTSNSFTNILYQISEKSLVDRVRGIFKGTPFESYDVGLLFTSSDTGTNCATACCVLFKDDENYAIVSKEHKLKHLGNAKPEDFALEVEKCFASVVEVMDILYGMQNESVYYLPDFVRHVGWAVGLNKKDVCDYSRNLPSAGTQFDAYLAICDIVSINYERIKNSPEMLFKANEMANEMLFIKNLASFDAPFEWVETVKA